MGGPASWAWAFWRGKNSRLSEAVRRLRKVLTLERSRRFADTAVIGGLDAYLRNFLAESALPPGHRLPQGLRSLPPRGHPRPPPAPAEMPGEALTGVSRAYAGKLKKLGVEKVSDLLWLFPFRYHDFSEVRPVSKLVVGEEETVLGEVWSSG